MLRITKIMQEKRIHNTQLADILGVSPQYISDVVNERKNITVAAAERLAVALNVPTAALFEGYEELHNGYTIGCGMTNCPYCHKKIRIRIS